MFYNPLNNNLTLELIDGLESSKVKVNRIEKALGISENLIAEDSRLSYMNASIEFAVIQLICDSFGITNYTGCNGKDLKILIRPKVTFNQMEELTSNMLMLMSVCSIGVDKRISLLVKALAVAEKGRAKFGKFDDIDMEEVNSAIYNVGKLLSERFREFEPIIFSNAEISESKRKLKMLHRMI